MTVMKISVNPSLFGIRKPVPASQDMGRVTGCQMQRAQEFTGIIITVKYFPDMTLGHVPNGKK